MNKLGVLLSFCVSVCCCSGCGPHGSDKQVFVLTIPDKYKDASGSEIGWWLSGSPENATQKHKVKIYLNSERLFAGTLKPALSLTPIRIFESVRLSKGMYRLKVIDLSYDKEEEVEFNSTNVTGITIGLVPFYIQPTKEGDPLPL